MKKEVKKVALWLLDLGVNVGIIIGLVFMIQAWIIAPFDVYGASMCDTLNFIDNECANDYGEKIIINEATYIFNKPERGDIVVFKIDGDDKFLIKRVIGLPGETVEIDNGKVYVSPENSDQRFELEEDYLNEKNKNNTQTYFEELTTFDVPEEHYMLMGDNRGSSTDSRSCFKRSISDECKKDPKQAFIHEDDIRGKAWVVLWPLDNIRTIKHTDYNNL